jgi:hypothetical protein
LFTKALPPNKDLSDTAGTNPDDSYLNPAGTYYRLRINLNGSDYDLTFTLDASIDYGPFLECGAVPIRWVQAGGGLDCRPDLAVTVLADAALVVEGDTINYTTTVYNLSATCEAQVVQLSDSLGGDLIPGTDPDGLLGAGATIAPGGTATATYSYLTDAGDGTLGYKRNTATIVSPNADTVAASETVTVACQAALDATITADVTEQVYGSDIVYTVTVENTDLSCIATGVVTVLQLTTNDGVLTDPSKLFTTGATLAPGEIATATVKHTVTQNDVNNGDIDAQVTAFAENAPDDTSPVETVTALGWYGYLATVSFQNDNFDDATASWIVNGGDALNAAGTATANDCSFFAAFLTSKDPNGHTWINVMDARVGQKAVYVVTQMSAVEASNYGLLTSTDATAVALQSFADEVHQFGFPIELLFTGKSYGQDAFLNNCGYFSFRFVDYMDHSSGVTFDGGVNHPTTRINEWTPIGWTSTDVAQGGTFVTATHPTTGDRWAVCNLFGTLYSGGSGAPTDMNGYAPQGGFLALGTCEGDVINPVEEPFT